MSTPSNSDRDSRIESLLSQWQERQTQPTPLEEKQLIDSHPDLAPELERELHKRKQVAQAARLAQGLDGSSASHWASEEFTTQQSAAARGQSVRVEVPGYRLVRLIAQGGQGAVYEAVHLATGRRVAVKILHAGALLSPSAKTRFEREVQMLAMLDHPGIVQILDRGNTADGEFYLTMPYIEGVGLDEWIRERHGPHPVPADAGQAPAVDPTPDEALLLFIRICDAINAAHLRGVVHRDLKPSNIRIHPDDGRPYVLDFGLAKAGMDLSEQAGGRHPTLTGQFLGSLPWASPEQADGDASRIDTRSDVYSLGVILYQMLTGRLPYEVAGTMREVLNAICTAQPQPPSAVLAARDLSDAQRRAAKVPPALNATVDAIVLKALHKQRESRYQTAGELSREIGNYLAGKPTQAVAAPLTESAPAEAGTPVQPASDLRSGSRWKIAATVATICVALLAWRVFTAAPTLETPTSPPQPALPEPAPPQPPGPDQTAPLAAAPPTTPEPEGPKANPSELYEPQLMEDGSLSPFARKIFPWWIRHAPAPGMPDRYFDTPKPPEVTIDGKIFKDRGLETVVRLTTKVFKGPIPAEMLTQIRCLWAVDVLIDDLDGIENLTQLQIAQLQGNPLLRDIRPLSKLRNLRSVRLDGAMIDSIRPLAGMKNLVHLSLAGTRVADLSPLAELPNLVEVNLEAIPAADLSPLASTRVERLYADSSSGTKFGFLHKMPQLTDLSLRLVRVDDVMFLWSLKNLKTVRMSEWKLVIPPATQLKEAVAAARARGVVVDLGELPPLTAEEIAQYERPRKPGENYLMIDGRLVRDANLEALLREELNLPTGILKPEHLKALTTLNASSRGIRDLTGLEHATNLKTLFLQGNQINDLTPLMPLRNLTELRIYNNPVANFMPLCTLSKLQSLNAGATGVTDLTGIADLPALADLTLNGCHLTDMKPLERAHKLVSLNIEGNPIANLDFLIWAKDLQVLNANDTEVSNLGFLGSTPKLKSAQFLNTRVDTRPDSPAMTAIEGAQSRGASIAVSTRAKK